MSKLQIEHYIVGPVQTNCYFIINKDTKELLVVDPGASGGRLAEFVKEKGYRPVAVLLTHGHFDHAGGVDDFQAAFSDAEIPIYAHIDEEETLENPELNLSASMDWNQHSYRADVFVRDGQKLSLAGFDIEVLHTPGHTPGGCCFYIPDEGVVFCGDSLFAGSIGRTDFPGGSASQLVQSVKEKLLVLPEETGMYPGHEGVTTVGEEKRYNPFLR